MHKNSDVARSALLHVLILRDRMGDVSLKVTQPSVYRQPSKQYLPDWRVAATPQVPARMRKRARMRDASISDGAKPASEMEKILSDGEHVVG